MTIAQIRIPEKLVPIFEGEADVRGAYGGRGSGKTRTFALMSAIRAHMWDMAGRSGIILCCRQYMNSLEDSSMEEIKAAIRSQPWLLPHFDIGERYIRTKSRRIHFSFVGLDRNIDSIKSKSRILLAWVDEAEPVTEEAWTKLIPTLREEDSETWLCWNPENRRSATHLRFRESRPDPRVKIVEINWKDNPFFPATLERTRQRDMRDRPDQYDWIWEGGFREIFEGAYYATQLNEAKQAGRIGDVPYDPELPVYTAFDLGIGDATAVWFFQVVGSEVRFIDYYEAHGQALPHYADVLDRKGYRYECHYVPHDARVRELGTGRTRVETMQALGLRPRLVPNAKLEDGINAVRTSFRNFWFDADRCEAGIDALRQYRTEFIEDAGTFKTKPLHNWASHGADAMRYAALAWREMTPEPEPRDVMAELTRKPTMAELLEELEYEDAE